MQMDTCVLYGIFLTTRCSHTILTSITAATLTKNVLHLKYSYFSSQGVNISCLLVGLSLCNKRSITQKVVDKFLEW